MQQTAGVNNDVENPSTSGTVGEAATDTTNVTDNENQFNEGSERMRSVEAGKKRKDSSEMKVKPKWFSNIKLPWVNSNKDQQDDGTDICNECSTCLPLVTSVKESVNNHPQNKELIHTESEGNHGKDNNDPQKSADSTKGTKIKNNVLRGNRGPKRIPNKLFDCIKRKQTKDDRDSCNDIDVRAPLVMKEVKKDNEAGNQEETSLQNVHEVKYLPQSNNRGSVYTIERDSCNDNNVSTPLMVRDNETGCHHGEEETSLQKIPEVEYLPRLNNSESVYSIDEIDEYTSSLQNVPEAKYLPRLNSSESVHNMDEMDNLLAQVQEDDLNSYSDDTLVPDDAQYWDSMASQWSLCPKDGRSQQVPAPTPIPTPGQCSDSDSDLKYADSDSNSDSSRQK